MLSLYYNKMPDELQRIIDGFMIDDGSRVIKQIEDNVLFQHLINQLNKLQAENDMLYHLIEIHDILLSEIDIDSDWSSTDYDVQSTDDVR